MIPAWAVLPSLANARKCQLEDFREKERYESCSVQRTCLADAFRKGKVLCALHQEFLFLVHEYLGSERPVSFEYRLLLD